MCLGHIENDHTTLPSPVSKNQSYRSFIDKKKGTRALRS